MWAYWRYLHHERSHDSAYAITTIVQTGPEREGLPTEYLAELLGLSVDLPTNIYQFHTSKACELLLKSIVIKDVNVRTFNPGTVYVDYTMRKPMAYLADCSNMAVDDEGILFPHEPFYTPKKLPILYLGLPEMGAPEQLWGQKIDSANYKAAMDILESASRIFGSHVRILKVDTSQAFADSYGQRQIVLSIEEMTTVEDRIIYLPRVLRLSTLNLQEALTNYLVLQKHLRSQAIKSVGDQPVVHLEPIVVDLRLSKLAYVKEGT